MLSRPLSLAGNVLLQGRRDVQAGERSYVAKVADYGLNALLDTGQTFAHFRSMDTGWDGAKRQGWGVSLHGEGCRGAAGPQTLCFKSEPDLN